MLIIFHYYQYKHNDTVSWYYSLESLSNQLPLDTHYLWGDYKPVSKVQSCKVCQAGAMITPLQKLLHLSTVENGKKYNIVMTWAPKEAESTLSMLEHMISIQIQSSEAPLLPFLMPCSQASMCITRNQPLCLQSPSRWCFRKRCWGAGIWHRQGISDSRLCTS